MNPNNPLSSFMNNTPHVVKNLILINALMLFASFLYNDFMVEHFAMYYPGSPSFHAYQLLTHMFMHGGFAHFLFNMYALWMFGSILEGIWGGQKFLVYYLATGFGAAALFILTQWFQVSQLETTMGAELVMQLKNEMINGDISSYGLPADVVETATSWYQLMLVPCLGASGAVFGLLLAFGMMFPETELRLLFPPIALKAKWFVIIYGVIELVLGFGSFNTGVAHFAHLGGMLFGFLILKYWQKKGRFTTDKW